MTAIPKHLLRTEHVRSIATHWISPDATELCRFATRHPSEVVWEDFLAEVEDCYRYADANPEDERAEARFEVDTMKAYAEMMINSE